MAGMTIRGHDKMPNRMSTQGPSGKGAQGGSIRPPTPGSAGGNVPTGARRMSTSAPGGKGAQGGSTRPAKTTGENVAGGAKRMPSYGKK